MTHMLNHRGPDQKGIYISKRTMDAFHETTKYIMQNSYKIQKSIEKNKLPLKKDMLEQISNVINR